MSAILVAIGLYVRVALEETPAFKAAMALDKRIAVPLGAVLRDHWAPLIQGSLAIVVCYALFYIATVYMLGYGVRSLGMSRVSLLEMLCVAIVFMARGDAGLRRARRPRRPASGAARLGRRRPPRSGSPMPALLAQGPGGVLAFLSLALGVMGLDLRAARRAAAGIVPDRSALHRGGERLQSRRHSRRLAGAVAGPDSRGDAAASPGSAITSPPPRRSASSRSSACARPATTG